MSIMCQKKVESSVGNHPGKDKKTKKLMPVCSDVPKKVITEILKS